ncbi:MAG: CoA transferase [Bauldia sp.]
MGNAHPNIVPYQEFAVRDGALIVAVGNDGQFRQFAEVIGEAGLAGDPLFASNEARNRQPQGAGAADRGAGGALPPRRSARAAGGRRACLPADQHVADVFADPQVIHRGMQMELTREHGGPVPSVRTPIVMDGSPLAYEHASPRLGEHTDAILAELGYDAADVARLRERGVIG